MRFPFRTIIALLLLQLTVPASTTAQYPFGKNKIQYAPKDWKVIETPHTEIFYYPEEIAIAEFVAGICEDVYYEYSDFYKLEFEHKIPIILYGTHHDFKETNVIPYFISEGTGGFTEFMKGRVAIPFIGSYGQFEGVFRHELAHAFMLEKLRIVNKKHRSYTYSHPPLWFTEGLAEYLAHGGPDSEAHMFMRDAITGEAFFPLTELYRIEGTYLMYKEGESALHYISMRFGRESIRLILENWWKSDSFDGVLKKTIGMDVAELNNDWQQYLKRRYFPAILNRRRIDEIAERLSPKERSFEMHPVCIRNGDTERVFCIGFGLGSIDLFELKEGKRGRHRRETVIRGGRSTRFESIPILRSRISIKGDTLVFVAKVGERDAIYLYDATEMKVLDRISFKGARIMSSPCISHDGRHIAFTAIDGTGKSDLFTGDLATRTFRRLTNDYYHDLHPDWHPSKDLLVFSSDRCQDGLDGKYALYTFDVETSRLAPITDGKYHDTDPRWLPDGDGVIFSSDRSGTYDIYTLRDARVIRQTNVLGGAFNPYPCSGGTRFLMAAYIGGTYRIFRAPLKDDGETRPLSFTSVTAPPWTPHTPDSILNFKKKDYRLRFGLDFIGAAFAVDPDFGYMGNGAQLFLTDLLGNHQLMILFGSASDDFDDFWRNVNVAVTYVNQSSRLNYAVGAFHLATYMRSYIESLRFERRYGVIGGISYPFSKFTRVDLSTVFKGMERDDDITYLGLQEGSSWLISNYISFTTDNIVWYIGGPLTGHRLNIALGNTLDLKGTDYESTTLHVDVRNYINISKRIVFAQRFVSRNAWGSDLQLFYLGGAWDLRGYDFREFFGKRIILINNELRFPLIDRFLLRFPFGHIDFPFFRGSLFFDIGRVDGFIHDTGWLGSFGTGVEMNLGYLPVVRINFSRLTDFKEIDDDTRVDFFIGFNY
ncbi:MAG: PD40 domain-containing protein [bacterium]|nr:MAG: PD40 domain-containing protein [bacterium]